MRKICSIVGARPQFIKALPLSRELRKCFNEVLIHTGQHYDYQMSNIFFEELQIPEPDYNLNVGSGCHGYQTGNMIIVIEEVLLKEKPDLIVVYGDTNSTLAGALAAIKLHIPIAHVEAGLRSFNRKMPEEINRILTDQVSSWLFTPSDVGVKNLLNEGIKENVFNVGDIMCDSVLLCKELIKKRNGNSNNIPNMDGYYLATIHRAENTDDINKLEEIFTIFGSVDKQVILPLHPRTKDRIKKNSLMIPQNVKIIEPVGYVDMINLMGNSDFVITDSGGIQKEAYYLKVPCITMRGETEWVETVEAGWNFLTGIDKGKIFSVLNTKDDIKKNSHPGLYGDGNTAEKIVSVLQNN